MFSVRQGVPGSQNYTVPPRAESSAKRQSLQLHTETSQVAIHVLLSTWQAQLPEQAVLHYILQAIAS